MTNGTVRLGDNPPAPGDEMSLDDERDLLLELL